jgi:ribosomal protein S18 acetylase RimI-like enzyme
MKRAEYSDKDLVVDILANSFDDNKSVNYIVKQDGKRIRRLKRLMEYSFDICYRYGDVFLSDDKKGCALIVMPDKKKTTFKSILLDAKLALICIGLSGIKKAMKRESRINKVHPDQPIYYLWFIGVDTKSQSIGIGSGLLKEVIKQSIVRNRPIYLETSTIKNLPWYQKFGFTIFEEIDFGYTLFCLKREVYAL